eukprot:TRINITY_DN6587_c0_g2_i1.p1 TRINITY_DN6587_c0_g2~~TRINITY_DN6587_c0_g2_i1.p1  ORF type:complete len:229 (-),score=11.75 TRINITY_DN6587_c0_g2_i1:59-745(-)
MKLFFRTLPEPLLTWKLYPLWVNSIKLREPDRLETTKKVLKALPTTHTMVLRALLELLHEVSLHSSVNKMTASNLGIVFGPTLLQKKDADPIEATLAMASSCDVVSYLIEECPNIYKEPEVKPPTPADGAEPSHEQTPAQPSPPTLTREDSTPLPPIPQEYVTSAEMDTTAPTSDETGLEVEGTVDGVGPEPEAEGEYYEPYEAMPPTTEIPTEDISGDTEKAAAATS